MDFNVAGYSEEIVELALKDENGNPVDDIGNNWYKRDERIINLSGGMKRRVLIAKALAHEPKILFLDEPTAGIDVEQRHAMWNMGRQLRETGVTVILTTHYIDEA